MVPGPISRLPTFAAWLLLGLAASNCGGDPTSGTRAPQPGTGATEMTYADGWLEVSIQANWAKTRLDHVGHFITSRNACGKDAWGVIDIEPWNRLASALNQYIGMQPLKTPRCSNLDQRAKLDGIADLVTISGKKPLLEVRGSELCSYVPDAALTQILFETINYVVLMADKEECPNGWGSG